ncbi:MAG: ABC transporter ATP-binding protein [Pseudomonadota bacterium]|nr:ABC transporter ATP-binding protein [Pseudomonadota bacterium]
MLLPCRDIAAAGFFIVHCAYADRRPLVRLSNVRRAYQEGGRARCVLDGVYAEISKGEYVVVTGRSGCGKSTLLNLISGIDSPDSGRIEVADKDLTAMSERDRTLFRRLHIGFVYQFFNLIPTLTVLENVSLLLALNGYPASIARARALAILAEVGLKTRAESFPDVLSGGEQQRVALARALVHRPWLVLADEPTGNLDVESGSHVAALLERLVRTTGTTLILVTHNEALAAKADRVLHMAAGRLHSR